MRLDQKPEIGTIVHLRPATKTAGRACQNHRAARVLSYEHLPYVKVEVQYRADEQHSDGDEIAVHISNIGLHPAANTGKTIGDMAGADTSGLKIPRPLYAKPKPLGLPDGYEEVPLF